MRITFWYSRWHHGDKVYTIPHRLKDSSLSWLLLYELQLDLNFHIAFLIQVDLQVQQSIRKNRTWLLVN